MQCMKQLLFALMDKGKDSFQTILLPAIQFPTILTFF